MPTELFDAHDVAQQPVTAITVRDLSAEITAMAPTDAAIAELSAQYMHLTIKGIDDQAGFAKVHTSRMTVKNLRIDIEKRRKDLKSDIVKVGKQIDDKAKRVTALLAPIEKHLEDEEGRINAEKERIKNAAKIKAEAEAAAAKAAEEARMKAESDRLAAERKALDEEKAKVAAEQKRLADLETARLRKIEDERIASEAAEKARIETEARVKREQEATRLKAENDRLEAEARAKAAEEARIAAEAKAAQDKIDADKRAAEAETQRLADVEAMRVATEARLAREAASREAEKISAEAERTRLESLRPDRAKLWAIATSVSSIVVPEVESREAMRAKTAIVTILERAAREIRNAVLAEMPEPLPVEEAESEECPFD